MTIRPVDLQTMIPKLPEVQKSRNVESELQKNNLNINLHKEQLQHEKNSKQVTETKKSQGTKVDREGHQKEKKRKKDNAKKDGHADDKDINEKDKQGKALTKIDIRI